jgi:hypothetical protein
MRLDCAPVNDFGYIGWASGTLEVKERTSAGSFYVEGDLELRYKFIDDPETVKVARVEGVVEKNGEYVSANVVSGADDLESVFFYLGSGVDSRIDAPNGSPSYQTRCGASTAQLPRGSDLYPLGTMRFTTNPDGTLDVQLDVQNVGNEPTSGASGRVRIGGATVSAALIASLGGDTLGPGDTGYLEASMPAGSLTRCAQADVVIDVDHAFQSGEPDPFANDGATASTPCLAWSTPISASSMGTPPDPFLEGKTLGGIVSSLEVGRKDNNRCSACHYGTSGNVYSSPVAAGGSGFIGATDIINGTSWAAPGGYAERFLTSSINKPDYLKAVVQQWLDDGARP